MILLIMIIFRAFLVDIKCIINTMINCLNGICHPVFVKTHTHKNNTKNQNRVVITMVIMEISTIIELIKTQNAEVRTEYKLF